MLEFVIGCKEGSAFSFLFVFSLCSARSSSCQEQGIDVPSTRSPPPPSPCLSPVPKSPNRSPSPSPSASPTPSFSPCLSPLGVTVKPDSLILPSVATPSSEEFSFSFKNHVPSPIAHRESWNLRRNYSLQDATTSQTSDHLGDNWILKNRSSPPVDHCKNWIDCGSASLPVCVNNELWEDCTPKEKGLGESGESEIQVSLNNSISSHGCQSEPAAQNFDQGLQFRSLDCYKRSSSVKLCNSATETVDMEDDKQELHRSASRVSEKALLFSQREDESKQSSEADPTFRKQKGNYWHIYLIYLYNLY